MGSPASIAFDSAGRLVLHDVNGISVYPAALRAAESPADYRIPSSVMQGPGPTRTTALARTPDGEAMVLVRASTMFLWRAQAPDTITPIELPARFASELTQQAGSGPRRPPPAIQISPRGDRLYTMAPKGSSGTLHAWAIDLDAGASSARAREVASATLPDAFTKIALRPDGKLLAVSDRTGQVTFFDASSLAVIGYLGQAGKPAEIAPPALAFSPDGHSLAVGSLEGAISLWSLAVPSHPRLSLHLPGHRGTVSNLVYDPGGRRLASSTFSDSIIEVWDLEVIEGELARLKLAD